ncbi:hypothetical protein [Parafilimonas terrae]|uniref:hypothetical protein n=1 Tax=Parafilimonas terrae TaxID=1465490 RepID=UPI000B8634E7|nr:hypothetical protein [Parafilimonas terrae]
MKKIISILFLLTYLFTTTEFYQFVKLPLLFEHLQAHEAGNKNETLWSFLNEHYLKQVDKNPDAAADMQLPFKEQNPSVAYNISTTVLIQPQSFFVMKPVEQTATDFPQYAQSFSPYTFGSNIWQPPKNC